MHTSKTAFNYKTINRKTLIALLKKISDSVVLSVLIFLCLTILASATGNAATYYMAPDGDNRDEGSVGSPWATLEYAQSQLSPGDTLYILSLIHI